MSQPPFPPSSTRQTFTATEECSSMPAPQDQATMHPENQPSSASTTTIQNTRLAHLLQNLLVSGHGTPRKLPTLLMLTTQLVLLSLVLAGTAAAGQIPTINVSAPLAQRNEPMTITAPGSACPGAEGQWNCMTASWQRCASGRWSVVMPCAAGTQCLPAGLSYDFRIERTTAAGGSEAPGGVPGIGPGGEWGPYRSGGVGGMSKVSVGWVVGVAVGGGLLVGWMA